MLADDLATPCVDRAFAYVEDVLKGRVPSCRRVMLAAKRHKRDMAKARKKGALYVFDAERAEHMCAAIEAMPHVVGAWAARGEKLILDPWQAFLIASIGGWIDAKTGFRRFRTVYVEVPRKNGKSTLLSALGLYFLALDGEPGAQVYSAAASTDQAKIVFNTSNAMAAQVADQLPLIVQMHAIKLAGDQAAEFKAIASQTKSKDGKNPHLAIIDELHEHEKRDVWDSMESALGSRDQPLLIAITTAGWNTAGVCYEQRKYLSNILDGVFDDDSYFGLIYEADEGDEPGDPDVWAKANPSLGGAKKLVSIEDHWRKAQASPQVLGEFLRKQLNIWTSVGTAAIDMDGWKAGQRADLNLADYAGERAYIGVDLAITNDIASVVVVIPQGDDWITFAWHFLPEKQIKRGGNDHLWGWHNAGHIITTPGAELDLRIVESLVLSLAGIKTAEDWGWPEFNLDVGQVSYDTQFAAQMAAEWEARGLTVVAIPSRASTLNEPFTRVITAAQNQRIITDGDPVLQWMAANTLQKTVQGGTFIYPAKLSPEDKIDGIVALCTAVAPLYQPDEVVPVSPWDDPNFSYRAA